MGKKINGKPHLDCAYRALRDDFLIPDEMNLAAGGGEERILVSAAFISRPVREALNPLIIGNRMNPFDFLKRPEVQVSLVGGIIAERPLAGGIDDQQLEHSFATAWQVAGFEEAVSKTEINPLFKLIGRSLVQTQVRFCERYLLDCSTEAPKRIFEHVKTLRYVLYAASRKPGICGRTLNEWICALRASVPSSKISSIPKRGFSFRLPAARKTAGTDDLLLRLGSEPTTGSRERQPSPALVEAILLEEDIETGFDSEDFSEDKSSSPNRSRTQLNTRYYISYMPPPDGIGHAEVELLLRTAARDANDPDRAGWRSCAQALLAVVGCMTPVAEIARLERQAGEGIRRYPPNRSSTESWTPSDMDRLCAQYILYQPPDLIEKSVMALADPKSIPSGHQLNSYLERTCRHATYARIKSYLLYTGPDFWGYSPVLPALSFDGHEQNRGVFASYVHLSFAISSTLKKLYSFIDFATTLRPQSCWPGYGCSHVPRRDCAIEFVQRWKTTASLAEQSSTLSELVQLLNGYTAGMHLLCCILCAGTRNYPGAPPALAEWSASFFVNTEKAHSVLVTWPKVLRDCLRIFQGLERRLLSVARKNGYAAAPRQGSDAYSLYELVIDEKRLRQNIVSPSRLVVALENCPSLSAFSSWHPNALRAFGMTELYSSGEFHTHEIEAFYGRTISALNPLHVHRLEPAAINDVRHRVEDYFRSLLLI